MSGRELPYYTFRFWALIFVFAILLFCKHFMVSAYKIGVGRDRVLGDA